MTVTILVPVLSRPHRVQPLVENVAAVTPEAHELIFVADHDDRVELAALCAVDAQVIVGHESSYPRKINLGYRQTGRDWLFLAADDVVFHPGWLAALLAQATDGIAVVGSNDGGVNRRVTRGLHSTHSLVRRSYVDDPGAAHDQPGTVLHDGYRHCYCDDELVGLARSRGVYAHAHQALVEHLHPYARTAPDDPIYRLGRQFMENDRQLYGQRRPAWE